MLHARHERIGRVTPKNLNSTTENAGVEIGKLGQETTEGTSNDELHVWQANCFLFF